MGMWNMCNYCQSQKGDLPCICILASHGTQKGILCRNDVSVPHKSKINKYTIYLLFHYNKDVRNMIWNLWLPNMRAAQY